MDLYQTVFEMIDMRSFSNLWYWISLAVVWSSASHWVLGVPYDLISRARRRGGEAEEDLIDLLRVNIKRILYIRRVAGIWLIALSSAVLTTLALLGFVYRLEFAQAVFLIAFPLSFVALLSVATADRIYLEEPMGPALYRILGRHRLMVQIIGMVSIFVTAMWGMYQNLDVGPWG